MLRWSAQSHCVNGNGRVHDSLFLGRLRIPPACIRSPEERTLFKSLGIAVEDLASAELVVRRAREQGVGSEVDF